MRGMGPNGIRWLLLALLAWAGGGVASDATEEVVLSDLSPLASSRELVSRLLTPIVQDRIGRFLEANPDHLKEQSIVAGKETYDVRVPAVAPGKRLGVLVFVWPADGIRPPGEWWAVLEKHGLAYVAARGSGNEENVFDRRVPLALHGYELIRRTHDIDPERVYIAGFSGGSRIAQRVALAYPDVFRGVVLIGGSDPMGEAGFTPPPLELMRLFQQRTRVVYATGGRDLPNRGKDQRARDSLAMMCVAGVSRVPQPRLDHWVPDGRGLDKALQAIDTPVSLPQGHAQCMDALSRDIDGKLDAVVEAIERKQLERAVEGLVEIDEVYGGLAAPRSVEIAQRLERAVQSQPD